MKASDLLQCCESSPSLRQQRRLVLLRNSLGVRDIQGYCLIKSSTRGALTRNFPLALWQHVAAWSNQVANVQRQRGKARDVTPSPMMPSVSTECVCRISHLRFVMCPRLRLVICWFNPYPTAFPYGNGMVQHFYQQQESSTTKTVHKVINKGLKTYIYSRLTLVRISINL